MSPKSKIPFDHTEENVKAQARTDGGNNLPNAELEELSSFELKLQNSCQEAASSVAGEYFQILEELDGAIKACSLEANEIFEAEKEHIESSCNAEVERIKADSGLSQAESLLDRNKTSFENKFNEYNRMPSAQLPIYVYLALIFLIGIGEVPLNALVFNIFGESQVMTWVVAAIVGLMLPLCAHFVGIKIVEHGLGFSWPNAIKAIVVAGLVSACLYVLAIMRHDYLQMIQKDIGLTDPVIQSSMLFFWINIVIFVAAVVASYLSHDPIPHYTKSYKDYLKAQKRVQKIGKKVEKALAEIEKKRAELIRSAAQKKVATKAKAFELMGKYDSSLREGQQEEKRWLNKLGELVSLYRQNNLNSRQDRLRPKSFSIKPGFELNLANMSEKLVNSESI